MASGKAENSGVMVILVALGIFFLWIYKSLKAMSIVKLILLFTGIAGCITLIVGLFWYFSRTTTEPRERTIRKPDGRYNVGYREEQETYSAEIPLSEGEIESNKRTGLRICIVGLMMSICLAFLSLAPVKQSNGTNSNSIRYISTESGMNLRETASATGKLLRVIPYRGEIEVLQSGKEEVIYGKKAAWLKVTFNGETGWIWGYYTSSEKP